ncbi:MAG: type 4a pilus biogenesis protein PilO [Clostridia bacterium]|nr:type 4a pilus biogenesis protein PilO [Clostridia bacterium]
MALAIGGSPKQQKLLIILLCVVAAAGLYTYVFAPQAAKYDSVKSQLADEGTKLTINLSKLKRAPAAEEELSAAIAELEGFENLVPSEDAIHYLYRDIESVSRKTGTSILDITMGARKERGRYVEVQVTASIVGKYNDILDFVEGLDALPRVINMNGFTLNARAESPESGVAWQDKLSKGPEGLISATVQMTTYVRAKGGDQVGDGSGPNGAKK